MMGRKTLGEVRAELEEALGAGPAGDSQVQESLRRFLSADRSSRDVPNDVLHLNGGVVPDLERSSTNDLPPAGQRQR